MDVLRKTPLFATLPDDDLRRVADLAVTRRFAKKEAVFREGDRADGFFIVASGKVKVFKLSGEGKEQILHVLEAGHTFAEAVIFEGGAIPRTRKRSPTRNFFSSRSARSSICWNATRKSRSGCWRPSPAGSSG